MKHIVKRNSDKKCESKIRICKEGRVDCIDGVITIVWEDCYADPDAVPPPVTPEVIANIRESNKRPELQWEKRRIRIRKKSKDGWEWTDYIDLQRDASTVAGLNVWRDGAIKYPSKYELIVDEMYQALHYLPPFHFDLERPEKWKEIPGDFESVVDYMEEHNARIDWAKLEVIYPEGAQ
jgi:hypothetical protein